MIVHQCVFPRSLAFTIIMLPVLVRAHLFSSTHYRFALKHSNITMMSIQFLDSEVCISPSSIVLALCRQSKTTVLCLYSELLLFPDIIFLFEGKPSKTMLAMKCIYSVHFLSDETSGGKPLDDGPATGPMPPRARRGGVSATPAATLRSESPINLSILSSACDRQEDVQQYSSFQIPNHIS